MVRLDSGPAQRHVLKGATRMPWLRGLSSVFDPNIETSLPVQVISTGTSCRDAITYTPHQVASRYVTSARSSLLLSGRFVDQRV